MTASSRTTDGLRRVLFWTVCVTAVVYAPMALGYMWHFFSADAPRWQESLTVAVNGRDYTYGDASVSWARDADYAEHRTIMLLHTSLGGLALALAMLQFSPALRRRGVHRWTGRVYLALMTVSMLFAIALLALTAPVDYEGGTTFDLQLWALAFGTLATAWYAVFLIRRGDIIGHRAYLAMNISFMMSAPFLRVIWIGFGPLFPDHTMLTNLGIGAIASGVILPAGGALAFLLSHRRSRPGPALLRWSTYGVAAALLTGGMIVFWLRFRVLIGSDVPAVLGLAYVVPGVALTGICLLGARRAHLAGAAARERRWMWVAYGGALSPMAVSILGFLAAIVYGPVEGLMTGAALGPPTTILPAFALVVHQASRKTNARNLSTQRSTDEQLASAV